MSNTKSLIKNICSKIDRIIHDAKTTTGATRTGTFLNLYSQLRAKINILSTMTGDLTVPDCFDRLDETIWETIDVLRVLEYRTTLVAEIKEITTPNVSETIKRILSDFDSIRLERERCLELKNEYEAYKQRLTIKGEEDPYI